MAGEKITQIKKILGDYCKKAEPFLLDIIPNDKNPLKNAYCVLLEGKYRDNCSYQDLTGFEVIYKLRQELRFKGSIVVLSFLDRDNIKKINYANKQRYPERILDTSNIEFYHIDGSIQNEQKIAFEISEFIVLKDEILLSEFGLDDVLDYSLDYSYLFSEVLHDLKDYKNSEDLDSFISNNKDKMLLCVKEEHYDSASVFLDNFCDHDISSEFRKIRNKLENYFFPKLKGSSNYNEKKGHLVLQERPEWCVIYIDDNQKARDEISKLFKSRNIECHAMSPNNPDVKNILNCGWVISDHRLKNKDKWYHRQGYDLLIDFMNTYGSDKVFSIFTSKDTIVKKGAGIISEAIKFYSKDIVIKDTLYFDDVIRKNLPLIEWHYTKNDKPKSGIWDITLEQYDNKTFFQIYNSFKIMVLNSGIRWNDFNKELFEELKIVTETSSSCDFVKAYESLGLKERKKVIQRNFLIDFKDKIKIRRIEIFGLVKFGISVLFEMNYPSELESNKILTKTKEEIERSIYNGRHSRRNQIGRFIGIKPGNLFNSSTKTIAKDELMKDDITFLKKAGLTL